MKIFSNESKLFILIDKKFGKFTRLAVSHASLWPQMITRDLMHIMTNELFWRYKSINQNKFIEVSYFWYRSLKYCTDDVEAHSETPCFISSKHSNGSHLWRIKFWQKWKIIIFGALTPNPKIVIFLRAWTFLSVYVPFIDESSVDMNVLGRRPILRKNHELIIYTFI